MTGRVYKPDGVQLERYLDSRANVVCIQGPVRSGKSVASIMRIYEAMMDVEPDHTGKRRSRWLVIRNSYPDLLNTTIKTWLEWFPEKLYGTFKWTPPYRHMMKFGDVEAEVIFQSFAGEEDIPSLKSLELTGAWINEAQYYSRKFAVAVLERTGWFPRPGGKEFLQIDMNAPPLGHWVPIMRGDAPPPEDWTESERRAHVKPDTWEFLVQPAWFVEKMDTSGSVLSYEINPEAENLGIVGPGRVMGLLEGRTKDEIDADLMNRVMISQSGLPVFPMFVRDFHIAKKKLEPVDGFPIHVGLDFGRRPAAVFMQCVGGRWFVLGELTALNTSAETFAPEVKRYLARHFPAWMAADGDKVHFWGDPSGDDKRSEVNDGTAFAIFQKNGMHVRKADTGNRRTIRLETMTRLLQSSPNGQPAIMFDPRACPKLTTALGGAYVFKRKMVSGSPTYHDEPLKNEFSDPVDACIEALMGGGEGRTTVGRTERARPVSTLRPVDVFGRGQRMGARASVYRR
jgi:hypothetical protein